MRRRFALRALCWWVGAATFLTLNDGVARFHNRVPPTLSSAKCPLLTRSMLLLPKIIFYSLFKICLTYFRGLLFFYINLSLTFRAKMLPFKLVCLEWLPFKQTLRVASVTKWGNPTLFHSWLAENWRRQVTRASSNNKVGIFLLFHHHPSVLALEWTSGKLFKDSLTFKHFKTSVWIMECSMPLSHWK